MTDRGDPERDETECIAPYTASLGRLRDSEIAALAGVPTSAVARARTALGIVRSYRKHGSATPDPLPPPADTDEDRAAASALRDQLAEIEALDRIRYDDPRFRAWFAKAEVDGGTARDAVEALSRGPARLARVHLAALLDQVTRNLALTFEEELQALTAAIVAPKYVPIVVKRLAFAGHPPPSLETIARDRGRTRERIRQIVRQFHRAAEGRPLWLPAFDAFLADVDALTPAGAPHTAAAAREHGAAGPWPPEAIAAAASAVHRRSILADADRVRDAMLLTADGPPLAPLTSALNSCRGVPGVGTPVWAAEAASQACGVDISPRDALHVAMCMPELEWLEPPGEAATFWWGRESRNRMITNIRKVLSVISPISVADLTAAVRDGQRDRLSWVVPEHVVAALCRHLQDVVVEDDLVRGDPPPTRDVLTEPERVLVDLFEREGPVLSYLRLRDGVLTTKLHIGNLPHALNRGPLVIQLERGVYALRGTLEGTPEVPVVPRAGRITFEGGRIGDRPAGVRAFAAWAHQMVDLALHRTSSRDRYVLRLSGLRYERWGFDDDEALYELIRAIANERRPAADAIALVQPTVLRTGGQELPGIGVTAEMGGWVMERWSADARDRLVEVPPVRVSEEGLWLGVPASQPLEVLLGCGPPTAEAKPSASY